MNTIVSQARLISPQFNLKPIGSSPETKNILYQGYYKFLSTRTTTLFGYNRNISSNNLSGIIKIYDEQSIIPDIDTFNIQQTMSTIREIIGYPTYDVSLILVDDGDMQQANLETRGIDKPTDILSFQLHEVDSKPGELVEPIFDLPEYYNLGDMMIDVPYVIRACEEDRFINEEENEIQSGTALNHETDHERGVSGALARVYDPQERIKLLLVHGMLHLVGYDHIEDYDYEIMVAKEEEVLKELQKRLHGDWCSVNVK